MTGEEKPDADAYKRIRKRFIWKYVLMWSAFMAIWKGIQHHPESVKEFISLGAVCLVFSPLMGLLLATLTWAFDGKRIYEATIAKERGISKRVPISKEYHPHGVIALSVVGFLIIAGDLLFAKTTLADYVLPTVIVAPLMLLQLVLDMRYADEEYVMRTTFPSPGFSFNQVMRIKWPGMLVILLMPLFGVLKVGGLFSACMVFWYPSQRYYYSKSQEEFGASSRGDEALS